MFIKTTDIEECIKRVDIVTSLSKEDRIFCPSVERYFSHKHIQGFTFRKKKRLFICFIGSNHLIDWFYNLWFKEIPYADKGTNKDIKVHKGFYKSYLYIREKLHSLVQEDEDIVIFGHSFGGTQAVFGSLDLNFNFPRKDVACVTMGCPRVGNAAFVKSFEKIVENVTRVVNGSDPIPALPFKILGYLHGGKLIQLGKRCLLPLRISKHLVKSYLKDFTI